MKNRKNAMIWICVLAWVAIGQQLCAQSPSLKKSNRMFEIISFSNDSVRFKAVVETKLYAVALMSDSQTFEAGTFSNSEGTVKWANGAQFRAGSIVRMPATHGVGAMTLPKGAVVKVFGFKTPENFKAEKIRFTTDDTNEMYYDIVKSVWDSNFDEKDEQPLPDEKPLTQEPVKTVTEQPVQQPVRTTQPATQTTAPVAQQTKPEEKKVQPEEKKVQLEEKKAPPEEKKVQPDVNFVQQDKPLTYSEKWRRWYLEFGFDVGIVPTKPTDRNPLPNPIKTMAPVGLVVNFGFYIHPKHRLSFDLGLGVHTREIGTFEYTKTNSKGVDEYFDDGVINRDYFLSTYLLSYHYMFTPSKKLHIRLGASFGGSNLSGTDSYTPEIDDAPDKNEESDSMVVFGPGVGLVWNFSERWFLDTGYRVLVGGGVQIDDFSLSAPATIHQFNMTIGFRF